MGSSRFPGKMLADLAGRPAVERVIKRLLRAKRLDAVVLATSTAPGDDALAAWAARTGVPVFRGSETDVLGRVLGAQEMMRGDLVVEVTGDTPLLDPAVIDLGVEAFLEGDADVVSNTRERTFPDGIDVQVFRRADLEEVARTVSDSEVREHVSLHFYRHPERYRIRHLAAPAAWRRPDVRLLLDHPEDLVLLRGVYEALEPRFGPAFGVGEILTLLDERPDLRDAATATAETPLR